MQVNSEVLGDGFFFLKNWSPGLLPEGPMMVIPTNSPEDPPSIPEVFYVVLKNPTFEQQKFW